MSARRLAASGFAALAAGCVLAAGAASAQSADAPGAPTIDRGRQLYTSYCARCHGVNMVSPGSAFFDLRTLESTERERFERSVTQGLRAMPAWGGILKPEDVQSLWQYVTAGR